MKNLLSHSNSVQGLKTVWTAVLLMLIGGAIATAQHKATRASQPTAQNEPTNSNTSPNQQIIINTDLVTLNVTVIDAHGLSVPGLEKKHFTVTEDNVRQEITFFSDADLPLSIGIVFDVSGSMKGKKFERAKEALSNFIQTSHPDDEYFLIGFNSQPQLLMDRSRDGDAVATKLSLGQIFSNESRNGVQGGAYEFNRNLGARRTGNCRATR